MPSFAFTFGKGRQHNTSFHGKELLSSKVYWVVLLVDAVADQIALQEEYTGRKESKCAKGGCVEFVRLSYFVCAKRVVMAKLAVCDLMAATVYV